MTDEALMEKAVSALERAYAPYSGLRVGAALEAVDGRVFTGVNVENASYGLSCCAERNAVFAAVAAGEREFRRVAVASSADAPIRPCGACLQVLHEFSPEIIVVLEAGESGVERRSLRDLLPEGFRLAGEGS